MHNRFFCSKDNISKDKVIIDDPKEIHHIVNVLRLKKNDDVVIFDGEGREFLGVIGNISKKEIEVLINKIIENKDKDYAITLACAIPKKAKFDFIVEKMTELGVDAIVPLITERSEVSFSKERMTAKVKRWRQIAINASKQSKNCFVPTIERIKPFKEFVPEIRNYDLALIPTLEGKRLSILEALESFKGKKIIVFIGPEGDFSKNEVELAKKLGSKPATLGERVLKVDTAAISAISIINHILEKNK